jgi:Trypsin-like peptidase domain
MIKNFTQKLRKNNNLKKEKKRWPELTWHGAAARIPKVLFQVYTNYGNGRGTCFLLSVATPEENVYYGMFATAWHVLKDVKSMEGIRLVSADRKKTLNSQNSTIHYEKLREEIYDTAIIIVKTDKPIIDEANLLPIPPKDLLLAQGAEIAWMGFPGLVEPAPCFFHGYISGYQDNPPRYIVDGVAINGVSGGPVFDKHAQLAGLVSAYRPNKRDDNVILPGVSLLLPINSIRYFMENLPNSITL